MDVKANAFRLASCQATIFTPEAALATTRLVRDVLPKWLSSVFDADPLILPQPAVDALPPDIPRAVLASKSGEYRCELSSGRINFYWNRITDEAADPELGRVFAQATEFFADYMRSQPVRVGRVAAVLNRFISYEKPGFFLAKHFCKEQWLKAPLNRPESFELHAHKRFTLGDRFTVNSWVRNKTGVSSFKQPSVPVILVEQDLNTLAEEAPEKSFSLTEIADYFSACASEFLHILRLYYP